MNNPKLIKKLWVLANRLYDDLSCFDTSKDKFYFLEISKVIYKTISTSEDFSKMYDLIIKSAVERLEYLNTQKDNCFNKTEIDYLNNEIFQKNQDVLIYTLLHDYRNSESSFLKELF